MSTGGCTRFKQNAWKKDLCSNCYKGKEEHQPPKERAVNYPELPVIPASQSILKGRESKKKKSVNVTFPKEESEVIGYGGDAESSDDDDDGPCFKSPDPEDEAPGEEEDDKALKLLTKTNTDFNSVLGNLTGEKSLISLPLGQQQKQKIQVTVQPFSCSPSPAKKIEQVTIQVKPETEPPPEEKKEEPKKTQEPRTCPEGRKVHITRGSVITKSHEIVKNKLCSQIKNEKKKILESDSDEAAQTKTASVTVGIVKSNPPIISGPEEVTVKVLKLLDGEEGPAESREMAGEPDGKADSDEAEAPLSPPPRHSFLHRDSSSSLPGDQKSAPPSPVAEIVEQSCKSSKRPAPKPPSSPDIQAQDLPKPPAPRPPDTLPLERVRTSSKSENTTPRRDPPPIPDPPKREESPQERAYEVVEFKAKTPTELNTNNRLSFDFGSQENHHRFSGEVTQDKKKSARMKVSLKKLLRFGSREEDHKYENEVLCRPRPQIIHPLDLNKSAVQILPSPTSEKPPTIEIPSSPDSPSSPSSPGSGMPGRPTKPPPPPRSESLNLMERLRTSSNMDNIYANLGEARSGIAPVKPQRTGSLREMKNKQLLIQSDTENFYECVGVSSVPECDMEEQRSIPYYGSETESDFYYPLIVNQNRESKMKQRKKGRNVVHKSLEENYGAVVLANHDALAQLLKQLISIRHEAPKVFQSCSNYQWTHFRVTDKEESITVNDITFLKAEYKSIPVTLATSSTDLRIPEPMGFITKFQDSVPSSVLRSSGSPVQASIAVLRRMNLETLEDFGKRLGNSVEGMKEGALVLLQLVQHLICCQSDSVLMPNYLVFSDNTDPGPTLCYLPQKALVSDASVKKEECFKEARKFFKGGDLLDKCNLADAQSVLQCWLWGPTTVLPLAALKRWVDLERANSLHNLVCSKYLSTPEKLHLAFLVNTDAEILLKALRHLQPSES